MKMTIKLLTMLMLTSILVFASCEDKEEEPAVLPTVTTSDFVAQQNGSGEGGGNVTADGGADVTVRGIVISSKANPTIGDNFKKTTDGAGTGAFTSKLGKGSLAPGFTYHCRAYATNSVGTTYGADKEFSVPVK